MLSRAGIQDLGSSTQHPACDLAFLRCGTLTIIEAKSLPSGSDEHQMSVGLGQLLQYRAALEGSDGLRRWLERLMVASATHSVPSPRGDQPVQRVHAFLAVPRRPSRSRTWQRACEDADVKLLVVKNTRNLRARLLGPSPT